MTDWFILGCIFGVGIVSFAAGFWLAVEMFQHIPDNNLTTLATPDRVRGQDEQSQG